MLGHELHQRCKSGVWYARSLSPTRLLTKLLLPLHSFNARLQLAVVVAFLVSSFFRRNDGAASALAPAAVTTASVAVSAQPAKPGKATRSAH